MLRSLFLGLLAACGRFGFDGTADAGPSVDVLGGADTAMTIDGPPGSVTLTFGEAPATVVKNITRDTYISNEAGEPLLNYGADNEVRIERDVNERALFAFDVTMLPTTATILSATLEVTVIQLPPAPSEIDLHRVLESWDEGSKAGTAGVANYLTRSGASSWSTAGAGPPLSATASIAQFMPALGRRTIVLPVSLISAWVAGPNHGLVMLSTNDDSTRLMTSEGIPAADRPVLTVTFNP